jgi:hypothetical protein
VESSRGRSAIPHSMLLRAYLYSDMSSVQENGKSMSRAIWKFPLAPPQAGDVSHCDMPAGAKVLTAREQGASVCVWAEVDPCASLERRSFHIIGTGKEVPENAGPYFGTAMLDEGVYVFHIYGKATTTSADQRSVSPVPSSGSSPC